MITELMTNIYIWMISSFVLIAIFLVLLIFLVILVIKTHTLAEFEAWIKGVPIGMFFQENGYIEWKPINPDNNIIIDRNYGAFAINEKATYVDKRTKNVIAVFNASYGDTSKASIKEISSELKYLLKNEEELHKFRQALDQKTVEETNVIKSIKYDLHFSAIKNMVSALTPHNINSKIEKIVSSRLSALSNVDVKSAILLFVGIFGVIVIATMLL